MANNYGQSSFSIPKFGCASGKLNLNPSEIDFDFDFLTQYLLFDEADVDNPDFLFESLKSVDSDTALPELVTSSSSRPVVKMENEGQQRDSSYNSTDSSGSSRSAHLEKERIAKNKNTLQSGEVPLKDEDCTSLDTEYSPGKKRKSEQTIKGTQSEKINRRRARNKVLAKQTRYRKKFFFESLQRQVSVLAMENQRLKDKVRSCEKMSPETKELILGACSWVPPDIITSSDLTASTALESNDYKLMAAIQAAQRSFVITDPSLADNPIIFASKGFLDLTGYLLHEVIGRNCRFLQGSETNREDVAKLHQGIANGVDTSVCLLNYRKDGTPFYNQIYVAPLRDAEMRIMNYVGVQVEIKTDMMPDQMLIQKCTDLKPPNGPKTVPRAAKKATPTAGTTSSSFSSSSSSSSSQGAVAAVPRPTLPSISSSSNLIQSINLMNSSNNMTNMMMSGMPFGYGAVNYNGSGIVNGIDNFFDVGIGGIVGMGNAQSFFNYGSTTDVNISAAPLNPSISVPASITSGKGSETALLGGSNRNKRQPSPSAFHSKQC